jgi:prepilin-type processing-associated H-X9-DG protein
MLRNIQALETRLKPLRCFNRPTNVFKTSRERLPDTLADIPGCIAPRVRSADPRSFGELEAVCTRFGRWPLIVRARGYHGGENMARVTRAADLETIRHERWPYGGIHLIEYVDFRGADGLYQKNRVIMVEGRPFPRHAVVSDRWAIHAGSRRDLMDREPSLRTREERFLAGFSETGLEQYARVFKNIHQRVGLDIFGIDFALLDGQVVVFEANACMHFLRHTRNPADYGYLDGHVTSLQRAVKRMLLRA